MSITNISGRSSCPEDIQTKLKLYKITKINKYTIELIEGKYKFINIVSLVKLEKKLTSKYIEKQDLFNCLSF